MTNNKEKIEKIATSVLVVIFVLFVARAVLKMNSRANPPVAAESMTIADVSISQHSLKRKELISKFQKVKWERNPFVQGGYGVLGGFDLMGIFWDAGQAYAIINNEVLKAGDAINDYRIIQVEQKTVTLTDGEEYFTLELKE